MPRRWEKEGLNSHIILWFVPEKRRHRKIWELQNWHFHKMFPYEFAQLRAHCPVDYHTFASIAIGARTIIYWLTLARLATSARVVIRKECSWFSPPNGPRGRMVLHSESNRLIVTHWMTRSRRSKFSLSNITNTNRINHWRTNAEGVRYQILIGWIALATVVRISAIESWFSQLWIIAV